MNPIKLLAIELTVLSLTYTPVRADMDSQLKALSDTFVKIVEDIDKAPEAERPKLYDKLREQVSSMSFALAYIPDGSDTIKTERSDDLLLNSVYSAFTADQAHLDRAIIHTGAREQAIALMPARARCLVAVYPVGSCKTCGERIYFVQYLARAYRYIPNSLAESVRSQMPRWKAEDRIPGLLILAENGDANAKTELDGFTSEDARRVKGLFRHLIDFEKKRDEKGASHTPRKID